MSMKESSVYRSQTQKERITSDLSKGLSDQTLSSALQPSVPTKREEEIPENTSTVSYRACPACYTRFDGIRDIYTNATLLSQHMSRFYAFESSHRRFTVIAQTGLFCFAGEQKSNLVQVQNEFYNCPYIHYGSGLGVVAA
jgi:hypothetical protein